MLYHRRKGEVFGKIYAVKVGRKTGLFHSWEECEKQVKEYKGAIYKSFSSEEEAKSYLKKPIKKVKPKQSQKKKKKILQKRKRVLKLNTKKEPKGKEEPLEERKSTEVLKENSSYLFSLRGIKPSTRP